MTDVTSFLQQLHNRGLVSDRQGDQHKAIDSPWYLKLLMAFSGWLAAAFGLAFLGLGVAQLFDSAPALSILGGVLLAVSFYFLSSSGSEFIEHLGLALSAAGQALIAFALFSVSDPNTVFTWSVLLVMQLALVVFMPNYIHRLISTYLATFCFAVLLDELNLVSIYSAIIMLGVGVIWVDEFRFGHQIKKYQAIGYGLVLGGIQYKTSMLFSGHGRTWEVQALSSLSPWVDEMLNFLVLLFVIYLMTNRKLLRLTRSEGVFAVCLLLLFIAASFFAYGIAFGLMVIILGHATNNRLLLSLGIVSVLFNLSSYYYMLNLTLLHKSIILTTLGCLALLIRYFHIRMSGYKEANDG